MNSMNLKRYIDAAVRREVRRVFFSDTEAFDIFANGFDPAVSMLYPRTFDTQLSNLSKHVRTGNRNKAEQVINNILFYISNHSPKYSISAQDYDDRVNHIRRYAKGILSGFDKPSRW